MSWTGLVWDLRAPPEAIVRGDRPVGRKIVEKVASELAGSFSVERYALRVRDAWAESHTVDDLADLAKRARGQVEARLAELSLSHLPTVPELRDKAEEMFNESPSLDAIVYRAHELLAMAVAAHVCDLALDTRQLFTSS